VAELALDDDQRHTFVGHLDGVGVTELVRCETSPHPGSHGGVPQLGSGARGRPVPPARRTRDDAEQGPDWELEPGLKPRLKLVPRPGVHADLAASIALAATDQQRSAAWVEIHFGERQRFLNAQSGPPEDDDETSQPLTVRSVAGRAHHGNDLFDLGRISRVAQPLVARRTPSVEPRDRCRRTASSCAVQHHVSHGPCSSTENDLSLRVRLARAPAIGFASKR
jgi:hypothetical protein